MLRKAFDAIMKDPETLAEVNKFKVDVTGDPGAELQAFAERLAATPPSVVEKAREAIGLTK